MTTSTFTAPPTQADEVEIKDFTIKEKRIKFRVDDDVFEAYGLLGLPLLQELVHAAHEIGDLVKEQNYDGFMQIFDKLLYPESATRFKERIASQGDDTIDVKRQLLPIIYYILEKHGVRPTQLSSDLSVGSPNGTGGTTSTDGELSEGSALTPSPAPISST